jgi:fatty-acid desaturase
MMNDKIIVITIAFIILLIGIIAAFITPENINLRKFHTSISVVFILIIILGIPVHFQRLIDKSSYNFITWLHFLIFSYLLYISILAFKRWNFPKKNNYSFENETKESTESNKFIVYYKNNKYNITDFIPKHPGGSIINNAKNKNLDEVWDSYNVSWHKTNPKVQNILKKYKMN